MGGKLGVLQYFKDEFHKLDDRIVDQIVLRQSETLTREHRKKLSAACGSWESESYIVRSSEPTDFYGAVGVMKTRSHVQEKELDEEIEAVRAKARKSKLLEYTGTEGLGYDPKRVTVGVAPTVSPHLSVTLTEHPNQRDDVCLVDLDLVPGGNNILKYQGREEVRNAHRHSMAFDCKDGKTVYAHETMTYGLRVDEITKECLHLRHLLRETGVLPNYSLQYEMGIHQGRAVLFQVKKIANRRIADFKLSNEHGQLSYRTFGVTNEDDGLVLPVVRGDINSFAYQTLRRKPQAFKPGDEAVPGAHAARSAA